MKTKKAFLLLLIGFLYCSHLNAQNCLRTDDISKKNNKNFHLQQPGHLYLYYPNKDSSYIQDIDLTEAMDVIVEFKEAPLFLSRQSSGLQKESSIAYQTLQTKFTNDINEIHSKVQKQFSMNFQIPQKKEEYYKIFFGAALSIPQAILQEVAALDYVKEVHMDKKYSINLKESVHLIGADSVWAVYGNSGDSVKIAILDTGIDYMHPALGKGFGKGFKVIGGYDFINKDSDPKDDHGHGTHVAGIVAGNGDSLKGVAPNALLLAFKVLDANGNGSESKIIAGIERTVDPDNDGNSNDKADIANMSLSGPGNPNDALSTALNNAVKLGVVFCVSAGNKWDYGTIGSPGCAKNALTVGSSDKLNNISNLSSKGPTSEVYSIKPDVLAPGTNIKSSVLNNSYAELSGTSMASPHVAGVCALIKKQHKDWTPEMIKSAVVSTAKSISRDVMTYGNGIVDAFKAVCASSFTIPTSISFGLDSQSENIWRKTDTLYVINKSGVSKNYSVSGDGVFPGVLLNVSPTDFLLNPDETKTIIINLSVNNSEVPDNISVHPFYSGFIKIKTANESIPVPWAFTKLSLMVLNFDSPGTNFSIKSKDFYMGSNSIQDFTATSKTCKVILPSGIYDIWASNMDSGNSFRIFYKTDIVVDKLKKVDVNFSESVYDINYKGVDETGRDFNLSGDLQNIIMLANSDPTIGGGLGFDNSGNKGKIKVNYLPTKIEISAAQFKKDLTSKREIRILQYPVEFGLFKNLDLKNKPADFLTQYININLQPDQKTYAADFGFGLSSVWGYDGMNPIKTREWLGTLYMTPATSKKNYYCLHFISNLNEDDMYQRNTWFTLRPLFIEADSFRVQIFSNKLDENTFFSSPSKSTLTLGDGVILPVCNLGWEFSGGKYSIYNYTEFFGHIGEYRISDQQYATYELRNSNDILIDSGLINTSKNIKIDPGNYKYLIKNNRYAVNGNFGKSILTTEIKVDNDFESIPEISDLKIYNCLGNPVSKLDSKEQGKIKISVLDFKKNVYDSISEAKVFIKNSLLPDWVELKPVGSQTGTNLKKNYFFSTGGLDEYDKAAIDMKISLKHNNGNKTEFLLQPAFVVGNYIPQEIIDSIYPANRISEFYLSDNYPNPFNSQTNINYEVPFKSPILIKVYDLLGREIDKLVDEVREKGKYSIKFDSGKLSSGVYFYTIKAGGFIRIKKMMLLK